MAYRREEALKPPTEVFDLSQSPVRPDHPDTLAAAISLSNLCGPLADDQAKALDAGRSDGARYPGVYGEDHPYNYGCLSNLALLRRVTGDPAAARALDEQALAGLTPGSGRTTTSRSAWP